MIRIAVLAIAIVVGSTAAARADARAEAILLFDKGIAEMKAGNYEAACKSFAKSNSLYPDSGTKGSLARCYEKLGKLASSWLLWRELADTAPTSDLRKDAGKQADRLDPRVPKYIVKVTSQTPGLVVTINGNPISVTGLPVPIDAGPVVAVATAPDHEEWKTELVAENKQTLAIEVPALVKIEKPDIIEPPPPPPPVLDTSKRKKRRMIAAGVAGAGVLAAIGGSVFGLSARGKFDDANDTCGGSVDNCLPDRIAEAQGQVDDARSAATLSSILFGVGGAAVVTGAVLWFTAPAAEQRGVAISPLAAPDAAGFVVSGRF